MRDYKRIRDTWAQLNSITGALNQLERTLEKKSMDAEHKIQQRKRQKELMVKEQLLGN